MTLMTPLITHLSRGAEFDEADRAHLRALAVGTARPVRIATGAELAREGERPACVHVLLDGMALRHHVTPDGRRTTLGLVLPGDPCELHALVLGRVDHGVAALTECHVLRLPAAAVEGLTTASPRLTRALWWSTLAEAALSRAWLLNQGRRADRRVAHLLCELHARLWAVGRADETGFPLPLTIAELAEALGLSSVHIRHVLQGLAHRSLALTQDHAVVVPDVAALRRFADFDAG